MAIATSTPRQLLRRDQRRAQILRAAAQAFSRDGYAATSVDEVAKQAGITKLIVYRHFDSKAALYRSILDEVATRLGEEWMANTDDQHQHGSAVRTLLTVARELPDGFRLLFVHAAREQEFAEYAEGFRSIQEELAERVVADRVVDEPLRTWIVRMMVRVVVASVLEWVEVGEPAGDEQFVDRATAGIRALVLAVSTPAPV
jgi:AcrR family transcriptional regulator